jgi:hypothetical protein
MMTRAKLLALSLAAAFVFGDIEFERAAVFGFKLDFGTPAEARIGRPLTPLSYAGVARRTSRRTTRRVVRRLTVLPAGCIYGPYAGAYYYRCGGYYYARSGGAYVQVYID